jgi:hypothetical protein
MVASQETKGLLAIAEYFQVSRKSSGEISAKKLSKLFLGQAHSIAIIQSVTDGILSRSFVPHCTAGIGISAYSP